LPNIGELLRQAAPPPSDHGPGLHRALPLLRQFTSTRACARLMRSEPLRLGERWHGLAEPCGYHLGQSPTTSTDGGQPVRCLHSKQVRARSPGTTIELLRPDFLRQLGRPCRRDWRPGPDVLNHNIETVPQALRQVAYPRGSTHAPWNLLETGARRLARAYTKIRCDGGAGRTATRRCWTCSGDLTSTGRHRHDRPVPLTRPEAPAGAAVVSPEQFSFRLHGETELDFPAVVQLRRFHRSSYHRR